MLIRFLASAVMWFVATAASGQVIKTQQEALAEVFASADTVLRATLFLDSAQVKELEQVSKSAIPSRVITYYTGLKNGRPLGYAFFEKQVVRTKEAIAMIIVDPALRLERVEVLVFREPQDYLPVPRWFDLFKSKELSPDLWPGKAIHAVSGATLSVRAFTQMARRALAVAALLFTEQQ